MPRCRQTRSSAAGEARLSLDPYVWQWSSTFHIGWALTETGSEGRGGDRPRMGAASVDPRKGSEEGQANHRQDRQQRQDDDSLQDRLRFHARHDDLPVAVLAEEAPPARPQRLPHPATADEWIPVDVVIEVAGEVGPRHQRRLQQLFLQGFQPAVVDHMLPAAGERVFLDEAPGRLLLDVVADDPNLFRIPYTQARFMGEADEANRHRVESLEAGGH